MDSGGKKEVIRDMKTERERIDALREIFGVELTDEERENVRPEVRLE